MNNNRFDVGPKKLQLVTKVTIMESEQDLL